MNHRKLVNIIKYSDLKDGEAVIKLNNEIIELRIQSLDISIEERSYTKVTVTGLVKSDV